MLKNSAIDPSAYDHYWTAHAIHYFTRLNNRTDTAVRRIMASAGVLKIWEETGFTVAIHIRHGDKRIEMTLIEDFHYATVLDLVRKLHTGNLSVFLASDDPESFKYLAERTGIRMYGIQTPYPEKDHYQAGLFYIADIYTAMRAKFTIGTWDSNYDRWLRELMDVAAGRASAPFFEVGKMPCFSAAHCQMLCRPFLKRS
jgi:hypothetical protein